MPTLLIFLFFAANILGADWPPVNFVTVKAYYYNAEGQESFPLVKGGQINPTVEQSADVSPENTKRLLNTINTKRYAGLIPGCYRPRHGFIFFDAAGKIVANYEFCLGCGICRSTPRGAAFLTDLSDLAKLLDELGLPIGRGLTAKEYLADYEKSGRMLHAPETPEGRALTEAKPEAEPDEKKPEVKLTAANVDGVEQPASSFKPWLPRDPQEFKGSYATEEKSSVGGKKLLNSVIKVQNLHGEWLVSGTIIETQPDYEFKHRYFAEPLLGNDIRYYWIEGWNGPIAFATHTPKSGKAVRGIIWGDLFYTRLDK